MADSEEGIEFAVCVNNTGYRIRYRASLKSHKIYGMLSDERAKSVGDPRIVDESGEDCLYPVEYCILTELPQAVEKPLLQKT